MHALLAPMQGFLLKTPARNATRQVEMDNFNHCKRKGGAGTLLPSLIQLQHIGAVESTAAELQKSQARPCQKSASNPVHVDSSSPLAH